MHYGWRWPDLLSASVCVCVCVCVCACVRACVRMWSSIHCDHALSCTYGGQVCNIIKGCLLECVYREPSLQGRSLVSLCSAAVEDGARLEGTVQLLMVSGGYQAW